MLEFDFRSDTVTEPTQEMVAAMQKTPLGNESWGEDPTVNKLQEMAAELTGKEAALFMVSGTMANLVAAMTHKQDSGFWGNEVIIEELQHTYWFETAGMSQLLGLSVRPLPAGTLSAENIKMAVRPHNNHAPRSLLLWLENSYMLNGGTVYSPRQMEEFCNAGKEAGLKVHTDGARLFNSAVAQGVAAAELVRRSDTVMFCLSKGLSCPMGSILCGPADFIEAAKRNRIMVGGGLRQAGIVAAAGIVALEEMLERLAEDHANARELAEGLFALSAGSVDLEEVQTNIVRVRPEALGITQKELVSELFTRGIKAMPLPNGMVRFVLHRHTTQKSVTYVLKTIKEIV